MKYLKKKKICLIKCSYFFDVENVSALSEGRRRPLKVLHWHSHRDSGWLSPGRSWISNNLLQDSTTPQPHYQPRLPFTPTNPSFRGTCCWMQRQSKKNRICGYENPNTTTTVTLYFFVLNLSSVNTGNSCWICLCTCAQFFF